MQLASRIWFCWKWLAWGKDALGAVQHLLAFVGLSQGIAFDSSDDDDCKPRRVKSCRLKRPSVFKTWSCQVMLGPSPPCWAVVQDGWGSRRQRSCQAGLQAPWGEVWMQQPGHHSISTTILLKKACQAAMWSHLSEGKSAFEDDLKEKNAKSPNVNLRSHLVIGKDRAGTSRNQRVLHLGGRPLKITKYSPWLRSRRPNRWRPWVQYRFFTRFSCLWDTFCLRKIWKTQWWRIDGEKTLEDSMDTTWPPG